MCSPPIFWSNQKTFGMIQKWHHFDLPGNCIGASPKFLLAENEPAVGTCHLQRAYQIPRGAPSPRLPEGRVATKTIVQNMAWRRKTGFQAQCGTCGAPPLHGSSTQTHSSPYSLPMQKKPKGSHWIVAYINFINTTRHLYSKVDVPYQCPGSFWA